MILSEYQARRETLEKKMEEINDREAKHMLQLSAEYQQTMQRISSKINNLKQQRAQEHKRHQANKQYVRHMYKEEKQRLIDSIHTLRLEYQTVNGLTDSRPAQVEKTKGGAA